MKKHILGFDFLSRSISPLQRFAVSEMRRRRKGKAHSTDIKLLRKRRIGKYLSSDKSGAGKGGLRKNSLNGIRQTGRWKKGLKSEPSNIEILGEIARIVTSTKILSGKITVLQLISLN